MTYEEQAIEALDHQYRRRMAEYVLAGWRFELRRPGPPYTLEVWTAYPPEGKLPHNSYTLLGLLHFMEDTR